MKKNIIYVLASVLIMACSNGNTNDTILPDNDTNGNNSNNGGNSGNWSIPISEVKDGGPGKDGIPSIDNPKFLNANEIDFLNDDDLVIGTISGNVVKAYPHLILDWHEILNDKINNEFVTINYCPLTGTAFGWKSMANSTKSTFGVSGLLYNSNLILYDRNTDSNWSQIKLECVNGELIGDKPELTNIIETNWKTWKFLYPNSKVLSTETSFSRNYDKYPYGDYKTNQGYFIFRPSIINNDLPNKERIYAIIDDDQSTVYQFSSFQNGHVVKDTFKDKQYLVVGNEHIIKAFNLNNTHADLTFSYNISTPGSFFKDTQGNKWSVFGEAIDGPRKGEKLVPAKSVVSFWFAIAAFYPNPKIYSN